MHEVSRKPGHRNAFLGPFQSQFAAGQQEGWECVFGQCAFETIPDTQWTPKVGNIRTLTFSAP